jgi:hypothetical protein
MESMYDTETIQDKSFLNIPEEKTKHKSIQMESIYDVSVKDSTKKDSDKPRPVSQIVEKPEILHDSLYDSPVVKNDSKISEKRIKTVEEEMMDGDESEIEVSKNDKEKRYKEGEKIGKGGMGTVYLVFSLISKHFRLMIQN